MTLFLLNYVTYPIFTYYSNTCHVMTIIAIQVSLFFPMFVTLILQRQHIRRLICSLAGAYFVFIVMASKHILQGSVKLNIIYNVEITQPLLSLVAGAALRWAGMVLASSFIYGIRDNLKTAFVIFITTCLVWESLLTSNGFALTGILNGIYCALLSRTFFKEYLATLVTLYLFDIIIAKVIEAILLVGVYISWLITTSTAVIAGALITLRLLALVSSLRYPFFLARHETDETLQTENIRELKKMKSTKVLTLSSVCKQNYCNAKL